MCLLAKNNGIYTGINAYKDNGKHFCQVDVPSFYNKVKRAESQRKPYSGIAATVNPLIICETVQITWIMATVIQVWLKRRTSRFSRSPGMIGAPVSARLFHMWEIEENISIAYG
jgi:hypothetical protein